MEFTGGEKILGGIIGGAIQNRKARKAAEKAEKKRNKLLEETDWDPSVYASELVPTYKKTNSPAAQAYFESMMNGTNPLLTPRNRTNATAIKAAQQRQMDDLYGTPAEIAARQAAAREETPWEVDSSGLASSDYEDREKALARAKEKGLFGRKAKQIARRAGG